MNSRYNSIAKSGGNLLQVMPAMVWQNECLLHGSVTRDCHVHVTAGAVLSIGVSLAVSNQLDLGHHCYRHVWDRIT